MNRALKIFLGWMVLPLFTACGFSDMSASHESDYYNPRPSPPVTYPTEPGEPDVSGDKYTAPGTNPFVMTAHDPLSTFAADVDTASYDIFRRDIQLGQLPHKDSVRLEEYVNYFPYAYPAPAPDSEVPFGITMAAATSPFDGTTLVSVGIKGQESPLGEAARQPGLSDRRLRQHDQRQQAAPGEEGAVRDPRGARSRRHASPS